MQVLRSPFARALDLMNRWDELKEDIRGTARHEQEAISCALDRLALPSDQDLDEWNIAMSVGAYTPIRGKPFSEYDTREMQAFAQEQANASPPSPPAVLHDDDLPF